MAANSLHFEQIAHLLDFCKHNKNLRTNWKCRLHSLPCLRLQAKKHEKQPRSHGSHRPHNENDDAASRMHKALEHNPKTAAESLISKLDDQSREAIKAALRAASDEDSQGNQDSPSTLTGKEAMVLTFKAAIGMVGFGFIDNSIMIIAGDAIQNTIGDAFGLSTMASAGLGNAVSDLFGSLLCGYIERVSEKFMPESHLSPSQMQSSRAQWAEQIGAATGVTFGCVLGLVPLLFISDTGSGSGGHTIASTSAERSLQSTTFASISNGLLGLRCADCSLGLVTSVSLLLVAKRLKETVSKWRKRNNR